MCLGVLFISCSVYVCIHASRSDPAQASVCVLLCLHVVTHACPGLVGRDCKYIHAGLCVCALRAANAAEHVGTHVPRPSASPKQGVSPQALGQGTHSWR